MVNPATLGIAVRIDPTLGSEGEPFPARATFVDPSDLASRLVQLSHS